MYAAAPAGRPTKEGTEHRWRVPDNNAVINLDACGRPRIKLRPVVSNGGKRDVLLFLIIYTYSNYLTAPV